LFLEGPRQISRPLTSDLILGEVLLPARHIIEIATLLFLRTAKREKIYPGRSARRQIRGCGYRIVSVQCTWPLIFWPRTRQIWVDCLFPGTGRFPMTREKEGRRSESGSWRGWIACSMPKGLNRWVWTRSRPRSASARKRSIGISHRGTTW
jgi:hypothetical protein